MFKYVLGPLYIHYKYAHLFPCFLSLTLSDLLLCFSYSLSIINIFRPERDETEDCGHLSLPTGMELIRAEIFLIKGGPHSPCVVCVCLYI